MFHKAQYLVLCGSPSILNLVVRSYTHMRLLCGWHSIHPLLPSPDTHVSTQISAFVADISSSMAAHQLKLYPRNNLLPFIPDDSPPHQYLVISLDNSLISPSVTAHNLEVTMDNHYPVPFTLLIWHIHVDFSFTTSEGFFHVYPHRLLKCLFRTLSFQDWNTAIRFQQIYLWASFDLCNWSKMQLNNLFSIFLGSLTPSH